jgi:hypothetical protein
MKKLFFVSSLILFVFMMGSCKKSESISVLKSNLLGKWTLSKYDDYHVPADAQSDYSANFPPGAFMEFKDGNADNFISDETGTGSTTSVWHEIDASHISISSLNTSNFEVVFAANTLTLTATVTSGGAQHIVKYSLTKP